MRLAALFFVALLSLSSRPVRATESACHQLLLLEYTHPYKKLLARKNYLKSFEIYLELDRPLHELEENLVEIADGVDFIERQKKPISADEVTALGHLSLELVSMYLKAQGVEHTVSLMAGEEDQAQKTIIVIQGGGTNNLLGRWAGIFKKHFPNHKIIYDPIALFEDQQMSVFNTTMTIANPKFFIDPIQVSQGFLHEIVHIRNMGKVGQMGATKGEIPSLVPTYLYDGFFQFQSYDEPQAFRRTIHVLLKKIRRAVRNSDKLEVHRLAHEIFWNSRYLLDTAGRDLWMAQKILELSDEAKTQFQQWSPTTVLATTEFEEGKNEYWDWQPLTISPEQKTDFKALLQSRYRQIVTANLKYIEPFEVISQLSRQLKNTSQTNEMEILIGLMWRNFLLSPSFH